MLEMDLMNASLVPLSKHTRVGTCLTEVGSNFTKLWCLMDSLLRYNTEYSIASRCTMSDLALQIMDELHNTRNVYRPLVNALSRP